MTWQSSQTIKKSKKSPDFAKSKKCWIQNSLFQGFNCQILFPESFMSGEKSTNADESRQIINPKLFIKINRSNSLIRSNEIHQNMKRFLWIKRKLQLHKESQKYNCEISLPDEWNILANKKFSVNQSEYSFIWKGIQL
jgi:hypothetical protein